MDRVSNKIPRILLVQDSPEAATRVVDCLRRQGLEPEVERADSAGALQAALERVQTRELGAASGPVRSFWDLIVSDFGLPGREALGSLERLRAAGLDVPLVVVSRADHSENVVAALRAGARDFVSLDQLERLASVVERELEAGARPVGDRVESAAALATRVAHEINNPLAYVIGNLDFALERLARARTDLGVELSEAVVALGQAREGSERIRATAQALATFAPPRPNPTPAAVSGPGPFAASTSPVPAPRRVVSAGAPSAQRARVLVIDDEPALCALVKRLLVPENEVITLLKAKLALAQLASDRGFDVILCDLMMPEMTGMEFHAELSRTIPELSSRVVFLTGGAFTSQAAGFLDSVPNRHLEKPFDPATLRATVAKLANVPRAATSAAASD